MVTAKQHHAGGAFGGKLYRNVHVACAASVAAVRIRRPVRLTLDLQTDMKNTGGRPPGEEDGVLVEEEKDSVLVEEEKDSVLVEEEKDSVLVEEEKEIVLVEEEKDGVLIEEEKDSVLVEEEKDSMLVVQGTGGGANVSI
jgi:hypothetical protein